MNMTILVTPSSIKVVYIEATGENDFATAAPIPEFTAQHTIVIIATTADRTQGRNGVILPELKGDVGAIIELHTMANAPFNNFAKVYNTAGDHIFDVGNIVLRKLVNDPIEYPAASVEHLFVGRWMVNSLLPVVLGEIG